MDNNKEFSTVPDEYRAMDRARLEIYAARLPIDQGHSVGAANAEIIRRDREYADQQEQSRRQFETTLDNAAAQRETMRQQSEEALAQRQMDHTTALAKEQVGAAQSAAKAAKWAAAATGVAALGAIAQAVIAALK
jgi:hypothetical protein